MPTRHATRCASKPPKFSAFMKRILRIRAPLSISTTCCCAPSSSCATTPTFVHRWSARFQYLMVDEFQDTNASQEELVRLLAGTRKNVCVVGDEDQSIYGWRGARAGNLKRFTQDFPGAKIIRLEQNYRSTQTILDAAAAVVQNNSDRLGKTLQGNIGAGNPLAILRSAGFHPPKPNSSAGKFPTYLRNEPDAQLAVLYRTGSQSRAFEEILRRLSVRHRVVGGFSFYQRAEVRNALAYVPPALSSRRRCFASARAERSSARNRSGHRRASRRARPRNKSISLGRDPRRRSRHRQAAHRRSERLSRNDRDLAGRSQRNFLPRNSSNAFSTAPAISTGSSSRTISSTPPAPTICANSPTPWPKRPSAARRSKTFSITPRWSPIPTNTTKPFRLADDPAQRQRDSNSTPSISRDWKKGLLPHSRAINGSAAELEEERRLFYVGMTRAKQSSSFSPARCIAAPMARSACAPRFLHASSLKFLAI